MNRLDVYTAVHKMHRARLFSLTVEAGKADPTDTVTMTRLAAAVDALAAELATHAGHEDRFIDPLLRRSAPSLAPASTPPMSRSMPASTASAKSRQPPRHPPSARPMIRTPCTARSPLSPPPTSSTSPSRKARPCYDLPGGTSRRSADPASRRRVLLALTPVQRAELAGLLQRLLSEARAPGRDNHDKENNK